MRLRIRDFTVSLSFPSLALVTVIVLSGINSGYILCLFAVILHELGHLIMMIIFKAEVSGFEISAFNITIVQNSRYSLSFGKDILCTLAGPAVNVLLFTVCSGFSRDFALVNLYIGAFNLLPASSLDGGQALYLLLCRKLSADRSALVSDVVTIITAALLFFIGIIILLNTKYNFSLLFISLYLILSVFMKKDKYL